MAASRLPFSRPVKPYMPVIALILVAIAVCVIMPPAAQAESTVHGRIYDWSTFKVVNSSVVTVNTTPGQKLVSGDGNYSFTLPAGSYCIRAESGKGPGMICAEENITVPDTGNFTIDLLLFPVTDLSTLHTLNDSLPADVPDAPPQGEWQGLLIAGAALSMAILVVLASAVAYFTYKGRKAIPAVPDASGEDAMGLDAMPLKPLSAAAKERVLRQDCVDVLKAIEKSGGRMTQLDLRKAVPYSEVRISLIVTDLEDAGLLRKVKKGRGNILILTAGRDDQARPGALPDEKMK